MAIVGLLALGLSDAAAATVVCPSVLTERIPVRPAGAVGASAFVEQTAGLDERQREVRIGAELLAGNLPGFLRHLKPVAMSGQAAGGGAAEVTICVTPDYLALGSDDDFMRIPMGLPTATAVAARFGFVLPTRKMVDAIYQQAEARLRPQPMTPGEAMRSSVYFWEHDRRIRAQRLALGLPLGVLIAGQKKDLVLTNRLWAKPGRVAIYGWHRGGGQPIQPLSTVHGARYADYSHGVRLVSAVAYVDGRPRPLVDALEDPRLANLVSDEGRIRRVAALMDEARPGRLILAARRVLADTTGAGCRVTVAC